MSPHGSYLTGPATRKCACSACEGPGAAGCFRNQIFGSAIRGAMLLCLLEEFLKLITLCVPPHHHANFELPGYNTGDFTDTKHQYFSNRRIPSWCPPLLILSHREVLSTLTHKSPSNIVAPYLVPGSTTAMDANTVELLQPLCLHCCRYK